MKTNKPPLYKPEDNTDLKLVIALNRSVNELNRQAAAIFRRHDLTTMQFAVLEILYHKGDLKVGQIIKEILTTGGNMTVVINNLVKAGLVSKRTDASDSRASIISLTEAGCQKMREVFPEYLANLRADLAKLSNSEKKLINTTLRKMNT